MPLFQALNSTLTETYPQHIAYIKALSIVYRLLHRVSKKRPTFGLLQLWHIFDRNVTDKVSNQKTYASALPGKMGKHENNIFTKMDLLCHLK